MRRRRLFSLSGALNAVKDKAKSLAIKGCVELGVKLVESKAKSTIGAENWKVAGEPCTRELLFAKCKAKVGRRLGLLDMVKNHSCPHPAGSKCGMPMCPKGKKVVFTMKKDSTGCVDHCSFECK